MGAVFAMQGIGQFAAAIIALIVTAGFKESLETAKDVAHCTGVCQLAVDKMWRTVIGMGAVPACVALYFRLTIPETPRYTFDVSRDIMKGESDINAYIKGQSEGHPDEVRRVTVLRNKRSEILVPKSSWVDFRTHFMQWENGMVLLGTAGSWFFLDVGKSISIAIDTWQSLTCLSFRWTRLKQFDYPRCNRLDWRKQRLSGLLPQCCRNLNSHLRWCHPWILGNCCYCGHDRSQTNSNCRVHHVDHPVHHYRVRLSSSERIPITVCSVSMLSHSSFSTSDQMRPHSLFLENAFPTRYRSTCHGISAASGKWAQSSRSVSLVPWSTKVLRRG